MSRDGDRFLPRGAVLPVREAGDKQVHQAEAGDRKNKTECEAAFDKTATGTPTGAWI